MNGHELLRKLQRLGRERGVEVRFDQERGKGSHGTLYFGDRRATLKEELKSGRGCCTRYCANSD